MMLEGRRIAILIEEGFEDAEFTESLRAMKGAGAKVFILGSGSHSRYNGKRGTVTIEVDGTTLQSRADDFDAIIIPGGHAPDKMRLVPSMIDLVKSANEQGKVIAAICHGPQLMISAEMLKGRRVTSWPSIAVDIRNAGAEWVDQPMVKDENIITSRKPSDLPKFNKAIIQALQNMH